MDILKRQITIFMRYLQVMNDVLDVSVLFYWRIKIETECLINQPFIVQKVHPNKNYECRQNNCQYKAYRRLASDSGKSHLRKSY